MEIVVRNLSAYYKGKKVFVTGHTGFKGSWLILWLQSLGAQVKGYALPPEEKSLYRQIDGDALCHSVLHDIRDASFLRDEIISFQPDFIFHLAAQPLVRLSYSIPKETFEVNVNGTMHLLEAVRELTHPCVVVVVTTDKVYENKELDYAYKEEDKLGGYDPYSASKAAAEIIVSCYRNSFFNPVNYAQHQKAIAVARAGNVIGGGDYSKDRIVPDLITALESHSAVFVRNPNAVRPWQHVLEPIWGYLQLGTALIDDPVTYSDAFNFGPDADDTLTVRELVKEAIKIWGGGDFKDVSEKNAPHEAGLLKLDNAKAKSMLGVFPKYSSVAAIGKTMEWYKNAAVKGSRLFCTEQINQYTKSQYGV